MASRVEVFDVTAVAGTPLAAPVATNVSFAPGTVEGVEVVIPDGVAGLAGWRLLQAHQAVIPRTAGKFITGNDETVKWPLDGYLNTGNWQIECYNTDGFDHTFEVRFLVNEIGTIAPGPDAGQPITTLGPDLGAAVDQAPETGITDTAGGLPPEPADDTPLAPDTGDTSGDTLPPEPPPDDTADTGGDQLPADDTLPPDGTAPDATADTTGNGDGGATSHQGAVSKGGKGGKRKPPAKPGKGKPAKRTGGATTVVSHVTLPAGGWLPAGARFTLRRIDQGQDFITDWRGPIIAPGPGVVVKIASDRPFPNGFGPRYAVVRIESGRWAGRTLYIGHATAAVNAGARFHTGTVLAHADQGHVEGGGWVELGEESAIGQGIRGQGAAIAHLFGPAVRTIRRPAPSRDVAVKGKGSGRVPAPRRARAPRGAPGGPSRAGTPARRAPASVRSSRAGAAQRAMPSPARRAPAPIRRAPAPPPRRAPPPPPPPAPRRTPAPAARRRR